MVRLREACPSWYLTNFFVKWDIPLVFEWCQNFKTKLLLRCVQQNKSNGQNIRIPVRISRADLKGYFIPHDFDSLHARDLSGNFVGSFVCVGASCSSRTTTPNTLPKSSRHGLGTTTLTCWSGPVSPQTSTPWRICGLSSRDGCVHKALSPWMSWRPVAWRSGTTYQQRHVPMQ